MSILHCAAHVCFDDSSKPEQGRQEIRRLSAPVVLGNACPVVICSIMWTWPFGVHQMTDDCDVWSWDPTAAAQTVVVGCHKTHTDVAAADFRQVSCGG